MTATIGPDGGRLELADGAALVFPAGALPSATDVRAEVRSSVPAQERGTTPVGAAYRFTPHGLSFAVPVEVRLPVAPGTSQAGVVWLADDEDVTWERVESVSLAADEVRFETTHLSVYQPVTAAGPSVEECRSPAQCNGHLCDRGWCEGHCSTDGDCAEGTPCLEGWCGGPGGLPDCANDGECLQGELCRDGTCRPEPAAPVPCASEADCPQGASCLSGYCGPIDCGGDGDCPSGLWCLHGTCETKVSCATGADCEGLEACVAAGCDVCQRGGCVACASDQEGHIFCG